MLFYSGRSKTNSKTLSADIGCEAKLKGGEKRATDPKGPTCDLLGFGKRQVPNPSRPISAAKAKPKGGEKRAIDPQGPKCIFLGFGEKQIQSPSLPISAGKAKPKGSEKEL